MIRAVHIQRFRGIRECVADGFGRVNLIIGRNDCGKTAFMEGLQLAEDAEDAAGYLRDQQRGRLGRGAKSHDFDRFWRPIFFDLDADQGLSISVTRYDNAQKTVEVRRGAVVDEIVVERNTPRAGLDDDEAAVNGVISSPTWALDLQLTTYNRAQSHQRIIATPTSLKLPPITGTSGSGWITSASGVGEHVIRFVSAMKQRGSDRTLVDLLREVDGHISGIELLAPGGDVAELFVRLDGGIPLLPVSLMGEGFQRCLVLGAVAAAHDLPTLFIDEIENGMHHLVLEPLWRWIATTTRRRGFQVFATTHSEECIQAASRAFQALDDDGLRVIRLDRLDSETRATIYDRALLETAERTGVEIRG